MSARRWISAASLAAVVAFASAPGQADPPAVDPSRLLSAEAAILDLDMDRARAELAALRGDDPRVVALKGELALYEQRCDEAVTLLSTAEVARSERGIALLDVARGCQRVVAATVADVDDASGVEVRYHDEQDRALTPLVLETVAAARAKLTEDLGVTWPRYTKITVVRDLVALSAMTGLPYKSAKTTGTVAVAKWGRVTLLSPRASNHGYAWRDTLVHELTHLAISRATQEHAPLWLHEGLAKREETRWRPPAPHDAVPDPDAVVQRGMKLHLDLPLDKLGPSIAMLPSADAAVVAFAEVTSFVAQLADTSPQVLPRLLGELRKNEDVDRALVAATGSDLKAWDARWRTRIHARVVTPLSPLFGLGAAPPGIGDMRDRERLAELLLGRDHPRAAKVELAALERASEELRSDPSYRYLLGRVLEASGEREAAFVPVSDPTAVSGAFGPYWALRGRLLAAQGAAEARPSFDYARAHEPFSVEAACETSPRSPPPSPAGLCAAAARRSEPDLGRD